MKHKKGPPSDSHSLLGPHIHSICEALDIPHIETRFDIDHGAKEFSINLFPQQKKLNEAILETVKYLNWTRYAIIYEGNKLQMNFYFLPLFSYQPFTSFLSEGDDNGLRADVLV